MRQPSPDRQKIRLMSEYSADFSLWNMGSDPDKEYLLSVGSLDITPELTADLLSWNGLFEEHFHYESGWRNDTARDAYASAGPRLLARLQAERGRDYDIWLDLWPVR